MHILSSLVREVEIVIHQKRSHVQIVQRPVLRVQQELPRVNVRLRLRRRLRESRCGPTPAPALAQGERRSPMRPQQIHVEESLHVSLALLNGPIAGVHHRQSRYRRRQTLCNLIQLLRSAVHRRLLSRIYQSNCKQDERRVKHYACA